ncbi:MAG: glycosyltransferase family 39 protein [Cyanomargarita calcarea GSE-NOS-MK-12-04C]|uniref:Glycosyltransferase family 39 protein n=1 Tax=Cyanomargarita calcarea GSE-NOS-MK-12-04C TaxID=2839659 RepID=A0A951QKJ9_9CYAN|nr:glycosyltransferase family 39 protein [Cyanomargarita calcarea GSE-NOS-MK-12-04C]
MLTTNRQRLRSLQFPTSRLRFCVVILLILGIFFRCVNLERKVYWHDEAYTSLRISGYTKTEFVQQVFDGQVIDVESLQKYQYPNSQKTALDTIKSLALEDAQHPPLYFLMLRLWMQIFGDSVAAARSLSVIISFLCFPCIYWLCIELFQSPIIGWMAVALLSVSPFHVLYAQEARQFSLWSVIITISSAVFLRAVMLGGIRLWAIYAVTVILGLYTFLFSALVAIAHGFYLVIIENFRFTKTVKAYLLAISCAFLAFVPWILVIINNISQIDSTTASAQKRQSLSGLISGWISNLSYIFGDFWRYEPFYPNLNLPILRWGRYLIPLILILVGYALWFIYRCTQKRVWLFIFSLSGVPGLTLILSDLIFGGKLSTRARYVIPCYIGIQLAIAYLLATKIISIKPIQQKLWRLVIVLVISTGIISCTVSSQAETWWNKGSHANPQIARIINQSDKPLLISSNYSLNIGDLMSLSHVLDNKVKVQLVTEPNIPNIPDNFKEIFLYNPSKKLKSDIEKKYKLNLVDKPGRLWRLSALNP